MARVASVRVVMAEAKEAFKVVVADYLTVRDLKELVEIVTRVPLADQRLVLRNQVLEHDDQLLANLDIQDGCTTIHLVRWPLAQPFKVTERVPSSYTMYAYPAM
jgi:hypothetical protein